MAIGDIWIYPHSTVVGTTSTTTWAPELITPFGRRFAEGRIELSRKERTANARLVVDIINTKKKFTLTYSEIDGGDMLGDDGRTLIGLNSLIDLYDLQVMLVMVIEYGGTRGTEQYDVIMSPIDMERVLMRDNGLWSGVTIEFEEV
jgi:hypothetical protein